MMTADLRWNGLLNFGGKALAEALAYNTTGAIHNVSIACLLQPSNTRVLGSACSDHSAVHGQSDSSGHCARHWCVSAATAHSCGSSHADPCDNLIGWIEEGLERNRQLGTTGQQQHQGGQQDGDRKVAASERPGSRSVLFADEQVSASTCQTALLTGYRA